MRSRADDVSVCRPDGHQNNLRSAAYEALMEIVKNSAKDCYPAVQKTTLVIMERLQQVLQMEVRRPSAVRSALRLSESAEKDGLHSKDLMLCFQNKTLTDS